MKNIGWRFGRASGNRGFRYEIGRFGILFSVFILAFLAVMPSISYALSVTQTPSSGSDTSDGAFNVTNVQTDNGTYDAYSSPSAYNEANYQEYLFNFSFSSADVISSVNITFNWYEADILGAKLEVYDGSGGYTNYTLNPTASNKTERTETVNVTGYLNTPGKVNAMKIRFLAYGTKSNKISNVDFVQVAVTYSSPNVVMTPDITAYQAKGATATYLHTITSDIDTVGLSAVSDQSFATRIYLDSDMNGIKDSGSPISEIFFASEGSQGIIVEVDIPAGASATDITTVTATGTSGPLDTASVTDTSYYIGTPPSEVVDGLKEADYLAPFASHKFFNFGPDPNMASGELYYYVKDGILHVYYAQNARNINDNTYGAYKQNVWKNTPHTLEALVGSDKTEFVFYDDSGNVKLAFFSDYTDTVTPSAQYPAGYHSLGITGGEGEMLVNNTVKTNEELGQLISFESSLAFNLNHYTFEVGGEPILNCGPQYGMVNLLVDSAPMDLDYYNILCPAAAEYQMDYAIEFAMPIADVFPNEPVINIVARAHNSPSKLFDSSQDNPPVGATATIGDTVWYDWDSDGLKDPFEAGISGVRVLLYWDRNGDNLFSGDELLLETLTDAEGRYLFPGLYGGEFVNKLAQLVYSGQYKVVIDESESLPDGTPNPVYGFTRTASDPYPFVFSDVIPDANHGNMGVDETYLGSDFGYRPEGGVIGDFVWADCDNDGAQDNGEMGISGVTLDLIDAATSAVIASTVTNDQGRYLFYGLDPGTYRVEVKAENFIAGGPLEGYTLTDGPDSETNPSGDLIVELDSWIFMADFGFHTSVCGTIGDVVYFNADWTPRGSENPPPYTGGDYGFGNVTLGIWEDSNHNGLRDTTDKYIGSATTDSNGYYIFRGLPVSSSGITYIVQVTDLHNVLGDFSAFYPVGGLSATLTTAAPEDLAVDFPYVAVGVIGDFIWHDIDRDGIQEDGEPGIAGVTVSLEYWNPDVSAWVLRGTAATDASGRYFFSGLRTTQPDGSAAQYRLTLTDTNGMLAGWTNSPVGQGGDPANDSNDPTILNYVYLGGTAPSFYPHNDLNVDFGYYNSTGVFGSIGDYIWNDASGLGDQDVTETGFANVTLELRDATTSNLIQSATTDGNGRYLFAGLPVSDEGIQYRVVVTDINGILAGYSMTTSPALLDVTLTTSSPDVMTADAGYKPIPTFARIASFEAYHQQGRVVVKWETSAENNTLGFYLFRLNEKTGEYESVNRHLVPALIGSPAGGAYRLVDGAAVPGGRYSYILTEIENRGASIHHGPFRVVVGQNREELSPDPAVSAFSRESFGMTAKRNERLKKGKVAITLSRASQKDGAGVSLSGDTQKIAVTGEGLYYIAGSELAALLGVTEDRVQGLIASKGIALSNMGNSVAYLPAANMSGIFFYGQQVESNYTDENVYWLDAKTKGIQIESEKSRGKTELVQGFSSFTERLHLEENLLPVTSVFTTDEDVDFWFWQDVFAGFDTREFLFTLTGKADVESDAVLSVHLQGASDFAANPDHHVMVSLNGTILSPKVPVSDTWDGMQRHTVDFAFSQQLLNEGQNTIAVEGMTDTGADFSLFLVDSFDLTFKKRYTAEENMLLCNAEGNSVIRIGGFTDPDIMVLNVTDPRSPKLNVSASVSLSGGTYSVSFVPESFQSRYLAITSDAAGSVARVWRDEPSELRGSGGADYLLITTAALKDTAQRMANYRSGQGLTSMVVDLEDIMDEFNSGVFSPRVIRDFLSYAYSHWSKVPRYVVLAGDGTYDYKDYYGYGGNLIPPFMKGTPDGLFPSDNYLADVNGDHVPEMAIGRLPVLNADELDKVISKIIAYENSGGGDWTKHVIMVAGDFDAAGDFPDDSDHVASLLPSGYTTEKIYLSQYSDLGVARQKLFAELGSGAVLLNYIGHSGPEQFGDYGSGLLLSTDGDSMTNSRLPVVTGMTCFVGNFAYPQTDSLSEVLTTKANGGAIAVWSPSGMSLNAEAVILDEEFFLSAFGGPEKTLGSVVLDALRQYRIRGSEHYMMDIYGILGDPALRLK